LIELALQELNQDQKGLSTNMVNLIGKLTRHHTTQTSLTASGQRETLESVADKMKTLFREEDREKFTPDSYQATLDQIVLQEPNLELADKETEQLRKQILNSSTERHNCAIIFNLLGSAEIHPDHCEVLQDNLIDLANFFLATGDFKGLGFLHQRLGQFLQQSPETAAERTKRLQQQLHSAEFHQEILDNLSRWDEKKQKEIASYIKLAGAAIADSLIERMAAEEDKSLRRVYLTSLAGLGQSAHPAIYANLKDKRWYLIRNLLAALRMQDAPVDTQKLTPLESHQHPRVNQELLQLLFKFDRDHANALLSKQLKSSDPQLQLHAVQLAELSNNPSIAETLLQLLQRDKLSDDSLPLKIQIIKSLNGIGAENALAALEMLLKPGFLFTPKRKLELQKAIISNLSNYPVARVAPLLQKLVRSRHKDISRLAAEKLRNVLRK
jgi:hypothetical protein